MSFEHEEKNQHLQANEPFDRSYKTQLLSRNVVGPVADVGHDEEINRSSTLPPQQQANSGALLLPASGMSYREAFLLGAGRFRCRFRTLSLISFIILVY